MPDNYLVKTIDPKNPSGPKIRAVFPNDLLLRAYKYDTVSFENAKAAVEVLENTSRIFSGLRELNEGGWCYTGRPREWCIAEGRVVLFPVDRIFAVYLNDQMWVYEWRAERSDPEDALNPIGWKNRFVGLIWKSTS